MASGPGVESNRASLVRLPSYAGAQASGVEACGLPGHSPLVALSTQL